MTYAINLRKAQQLMGGMEMYARINRFAAEHAAFMAEPDAFRLRTLRNKVGAGTKTVQEDGYVMWVYEYYMYLQNDTDYNGETRLNELRTVMRDLNNYRFPEPKPAHYYEQLHQDRMRRLNDPRHIAQDYANALRGREWHNREQNRGYIHEAVFSAWQYAKPDSIDQLMMEWPRISKQGEHMIAYTRDEKYGEADRQLVTSVSKYLARHFTAVSSNIIRNIAALYVEAKIEITHDHAKILEVIENGPNSCMSGETDGFSSCEGHHPYEVYDPKLGWHMAYVKEGEHYTGRVMLNEMTFVRTYRGGHNRSYSDTDERLNAWLVEQGYSKARDWEGYKFKRIEVNNDCGFVAPYLDGCSKDVNVRSNHILVVADGCGEYTCNSQNGDAEERVGCRCSCCGDRMGEDDSCSVGRHGDESVCQHCYENDYQVVYGRRGEQYAIPNDDAIEVDGEWYHDEWLSDNDIVQLHNGEYTHSDNAVWVESCNEYYESGDESICYTKDGEHELKDDCVELHDGEWCLSDDAWMCEHSGDYYENDVGSVSTVCGKRIHEDYADQYEIAETDIAQVAIAAYINAA